MASFLRAGPTIGELHGTEQTPELTLAEVDPDKPRRERPGRPGAT